MRFLVVNEDSNKGQLETTRLYNVAIRWFSAKTARSQHAVRENMYESNSLSHLQDEFKPKRKPPAHGPSHFASVYFCREGICRNYPSRSAKV